MNKRPRVIILNKADLPEALELAEFVKPEFEQMGLKTFIVSTVSHQGLKELGYYLANLVTFLRKKLRAQSDQEEERVVIHPLESGRGRKDSSRDFTLERRQNRNGQYWFQVRGEKPERWVRQTNFDNEEAVGYLADRLAGLGVEDALRREGARPGDEVRIGPGDTAMAFDWDPTIAAGAEMLDGRPQIARGKDIRLEETEGHNRRRTNSQRRADYHRMMDARQAVRQIMDQERKAGHWADPSIADDPHDREGLLGRPQAGEGDQEDLAGEGD